MAAIAGRQTPSVLSTDVNGVRHSEPVVHNHRPLCWWRQSRTWGGPASFHCAKLLRKSLCHTTTPLVVFSHAPTPTTPTTLSVCVSARDRNVVLLCLQVTSTRKQMPSYTFGLKHSQYAGEIMNPPLDEESAPCIIAGGPIWVTYVW